MKIKNLKSIWLGLVSILILMVIVGFWLRMENRITKGTKINQEIPKQTHYKFREIVVGGNRIKVEIADEAGEITKGLGDRDDIGSDGMLFVMPHREMPTFWMKGMRFDLDFIWIDCGMKNSDFRFQNSKNRECVVVDVHENIKSVDHNNGKMEYVSPRQPVTHVLEVNSGWIQKNKPIVGTAVVIN